MFKRVKFQWAEGKIVSTMEGKNVSLDEVVKLLKDEHVMNLTVTRMSASTYLKSKGAVNAMKE